MMATAFVSAKWITAFMLVSLCFIACAQTGGGQMSVESPKATQTPVVEEHPSQLIGIWQAAKAKGAGWSDAYQFFADGTFKFNANQMDCAKREVARDGIWRVSKENLVLQTTQKTIINGGKLVAATGSCASEQELIDGTQVVEKVSHTEDTVLPLKQIRKDDENERLTIHIGNAQFWKFDDDPRRYP